MTNYSPKFPLSFSLQGGYTSNQTVKDVVKQNLKNLILTSPGERVMIPEFGVGIRNFLFEQNSQSTITAIRQKIDEQVEQYMPFVELQEVNTESNENELYIRIKYFIIPIGEDDILSINI